MSGPKITYDDPDQDPAAKEKINADLARANLLRMRGEYKAAIDQCLSILKRMPDDLDAHSLIGDIYSESGDLVQAAQWFELALELDPSSPALRTKLEAVRERAQHREIAETAEQLGLPTEGPRIAFYGAAIVVFTVVIVIAAYLVGQRHPVAKRSPMPISIDAQGASGRQSNPSAPGESDGGTEGNALPAAASSYMPQDDRALTVTLSHLPLGSHIMSVSEDPRTKCVTIDYVVHADEDVRKIGAELARSAFDQAPDAITMTVRGVRDDKLIYVADVLKDKLAEAIQDNASQNGPDDGWIADAVSNEWTPAGSATAPSSANPPATTTTPSGTTPATTPKDPDNPATSNSTTGT